MTSAPCTGHWHSNSPDHTANGMAKKPWAHLAIYKGYWDGSPSGLMI